MTRHTCIIVDDEHLARTLLTNYVSKLPNWELINVCENSMQALELISDQSIDVLLLDIHMPDLTGLELLNTLSHPPLTILTTAYADYALEGYELDVLDYLLKPISFERFVQAMNKASEQLKLIEMAESGMHSENSEHDIDSQVSNTAERDHIFVKADYKLVKITFSEILYIEGLREYISIFTSEKRYIVYHSLKNMENLLPEGAFIRIHKSYIVPLDQIASIYGNTVVIRDKELPIGKSYKSQLMDRIQQL